jgi:hypothetical protein
MKRIFYRGTPKTAILNWVASLIEQTGDYEITVDDRKKRRSLSQNAFLWGVVYPYIIEGGGEALAGWQPEDLHEYFLGEVYGWEMLDGMGRKRMKPIKRSSRMTKTEFVDYLQAISERCAKLGIIIPEPMIEEGQWHK